MSRFIGILLLVAIGCLAVHGTTCNDDAVPPMPKGDRHHMGER